MKNYVFLAEGFEEIEATTPIDIMRRAGLDVKSVSISDSLEVRGANGIVVKADMHLKDCDFEKANWLIIPGGMPGASNIRACAPLCEALVEHYTTGGNIAAICAAPGEVLAPLGILKGKKATCYPGFEPACKEGGAEMVKAPVAVDENLITGNGPGAAMAYGYAIVAATLGHAVADELSNAMMYVKATKA